MAIAGHVSPKMLAHYSHVRLAAKRTALELLSRNAAQQLNTQSRPASHVTIHVTNATNPPSASPQVVEKYGRPRRIRTADLTTLDLYSQSIDAGKLEAQEDIALAITSTAAGD
jgi:hypothetical protein